MSFRVPTVAPGPRREGTCVLTASEVSADKLRGGFYSPPGLVRVCLDRVASLLGSEGSLRVLEPSAGDGAFVTGLEQHPLGERVAWLTGVEILASEAATTARRIQDARFDGEAVNASVLRWSLSVREPYDVTLGNPPFVRFQFVDGAERSAADHVGLRASVAFKGVSNLWLPVLVAALSALRPGGVFSFIVPAECFTGVSGHAVRQWLLERVQRLEVDLFPPGSFPGVLQEVVVLSGRMTSSGSVASRDVHLREHGEGSPREWRHQRVGASRTWTSLLLSPRQMQSLEAARALPSVVPIGEVARFEVATVTGANAFFCVDDDTVDAFELEPWILPLLPRTRHAAGLAFTDDDHTTLREQGASGALLDFSRARPDPMERSGPRRYLSAGVSDGLPERYKCRIREPWYQVPVVRPGVLLMAKRSHRYPRVIVNDAGAVTTDTIYRGRLAGTVATSPREVAASFHNSLTLLTAEIEGRSFGGGVLELVPSEISRLLLPWSGDMADEFDRLDWLIRSNGGEEGDGLVDETDQLVIKKTPGLDQELMDELREALGVLRGLRLARNA